jgi:hypothetical protein
LSAGVNEEAEAAITVFSNMQREILRMQQQKHQLTEQIEKQQQKLQKLHDDYKEVIQLGNEKHLSLQIIQQKIQDSEAYLAATEQRIERKIGEWGGRNKAAKQREQHIKQWEQELQLWQNELEEWQEYRDYRDQYDIDLDRQETQYQHLEGLTRQLQQERQQLEETVQMLQEEAEAASETKKVSIFFFGNYPFFLLNLTSTVSSYYQIEKKAAQELIRMARREAAQVIISSHTRATAVATLLLLYFELQVEAKAAAAIQQMESSFITATEKAKQDAVAAMEAADQRITEALRAAALSPTAPAAVDSALDTVLSGLQDLILAERQNQAVEEQSRLAAMQLRAIRAESTQVVVVFNIQQVII